jgi:hypothetical protein
MQAGRDDSHEERASLRPTPTVVTRLAARTRRPVHPKLMRGGASSGRPWCGPLPLARVSPARSLGDLGVTDLRYGVKGACSRLAEVLESAAGRRSPATRPEAVVKTKGSRDPNSNPERPVVVPVGLCGPALWAVSDRGYPGLMFHGSQGLGTLFARGDGRFGSSSSSRAPYPYRPRAPGDAAPPPHEPLAGASMLQAGGRWTPRPRGLPAARGVMDSRPWPGAGLGPRGGHGLGRPPPGGWSASRRDGPVRGHGDRLVDRDKM